MNYISVRLLLKKKEKQLPRHPPLFIAVLLKLFC